MTHCKRRRCAFWFALTAISSVQRQLLCTQVQVGDVIYIEANSGSVKRVGRCDTYSSEYDLEVSAFEYMPPLS